LTEVSKFVVAFVLGLVVSVAAYKFLGVPHFLGVPGDWGRASYVSVRLESPFAPVAQDPSYYGPALCGATVKIENRYGHTVSLSFYVRRKGQPIATTPGQDSYGSPSGGGGDNGYDGSAGPNGSYDSQYGGSQQNDGGYSQDNADPSDTPYGFVYLDICKHYHEDWSSTLSHEVLELLADPTAVKTVTGARPHGSRSKRPSVYYDLEVCDPTQGDTYSIHGVIVSNFVTKAYFGIPGGATSATNFRQLELAPFGVRPGGYFQYEDEHGAHEIDGEKVTPERKTARKLLGPYRRNARRALTFKLVD